MFAHESRSRQQTAPPVRQRTEPLAPAASLPVVAPKVCPCGGECPRCIMQKGISQNHDHSDHNASHHGRALPITIGNQRTPGLLSHPVAIQPKLMINQPGDQYEQEADRVAEQVMRMPDPVAAPMLRTPAGDGASLQRRCAECEEEEGEKNPTQANRLWSRVRATRCRHRGISHPIRKSRGRRAAQMRGLCRRRERVCRHTFAQRIRRANRRRWSPGTAHLAQDRAACACW